MLRSTATNEIFIIKGNGEREPFNLFKLENSLLKAGASPVAIEKVVGKLKGEVTDGMTTSDLYHRAFFLLRNYEKQSAVRYSIRRAVQDLGPAGFLFEKLIAEIFKAQGYTVETDKMVQGGCTEHELDVIAYNDKKLIMTEVKFHNQPGMTTDLKVALYVKARFDDLRKMQFVYGGKERSLSEGILITNTKFTKTAIGYAMCAGVGIIGWNYPARDNLHQLIEQYQLDPITALSSLSKDEKKYLLDKGVLLCKELLKNQDILAQAGFSQSHINSIVEEIKLLNITL